MFDQIHTIVYNNDIRWGQMPIKNNIKRNSSELFFTERVGITCDC